MDDSAREHDEFWTHRVSKEFVSPFANFSSWRSARSQRTAATGRTPVAVEIRPTESLANPNQKTNTPPPGLQKHTVDQPTLDIFSGFNIVNTITDFVTLGLLAAAGRSVELTLITMGLVAATLLRFGAVYQYHERVQWLQMPFNLLFGSRYGWSEQHDKSLLANAKLGVQFGFPLILHSVADLIQHGFSFYPLVIVVSGGNVGDVEDYYTAFCVSLVFTVLAMMISLLVRLSYGATLIELSLLTIYASQFLAFAMFGLVFNQFAEGKIYTKDNVYPWLRFFAVTSSAFSTAATEVRQKKRIILPGVLSSIVGVIFLTDAVSAILVIIDPDTFVDPDLGKSVLDEDVVVDQLIYANALYGAYVLMFMFIQWRLLLQGQME